MKKLQASLLIGLLALVVLAPAHAQSQRPEAVPAATGVDATGVDAGLAVKFGPATVEELTVLTNGGRMLVDCLVADRAKADALRADVAKAGLTGLVTVRHHVAGQPLPYISATVNLLIADEVDEAEAKRVLAPFGARFSGGKVTRVPLPDDMDEWGHANRDGAQTNWSRDRQVGPPMGFRWLSPDISNGGMHGFGGMEKVPLRLSGGRLFTLIAEKDPEQNRVWTALEGRNAFNGVRMWTVPCTVFSKFHSQYVTATPDRVYAYLNESGPLACLDAATGKLVRNFEPSAPYVFQRTRPIDPHKASPELELLKENQWALNNAQTIVAGDVLLVQREGSLTVYTESTGEQRWTKTWPEVRFMQAAVTGNRIYLVQQTRTQAFKVHRGVPDGLVLTRVVALDLANGKQLWERSDLVPEGESAMMYQPPLIHQDRVVLPIKLLDYPGSKGSANSTMAGGWIFTALDAATGANLWSTRSKGAGGDMDANIWWLSGAYINAKGELWIGYTRDSTGIDTATGKLLKATSHVGDYCAWNRGMGDWKVTGTIWFNTVRQEVLTLGSVRPGCLDSVFPAYGAVYSYNHLCACAKWVVARVAMTSDPLRPPLPDGERLESFAPVVPTAEAPGGWRHLMGDAQRSGRVDGNLPQSTGSLTWRTPLDQPNPAGPVALDWLNDATVRPTIPPVLAENLVVVARGHQHAVIALDATTGRERWRTTLGGRISAPPVIWRGHAYVACRDGWVYALGLDDGRVRWRHLVAADRRLLVSAGQLESPWPVSGAMVIHDGALYACAGITSQHDGGLWMTRLDPTTGKSRWRQRVLLHNDVWSGVRNEPIAAIDGRIWMDTVSFDPETGAVANEIAVMTGKQDRQGNILVAPVTQKKNKVAIPAASDPREALVTVRGRTRFVEPSPNYPGFGGALNLMLQPFASTNHRGSGTYHWATDTRGHYRQGTAAMGQKGVTNNSSLLSAWDPAQVDAGSSKVKEPLWKLASISSPVGMAMDAENILVVGAGNGESRAPFIGGRGGKETELHWFARRDGSDAGRAKIPGLVTWRGVAVSGGQLILSFEDGSVGCWK